MSQSSLILPQDGKLKVIALVALCSAPLFFGALSVYLGQDTNWDLRNYHWYNAYAFLNGRYGKDFLPSQTPWFYNPLLDVPFFYLATHVEAKIAGFVLGCVQGLNFVFLFMLAHASLKHLSPQWKVAFCFFLAALGMLGGGGIGLLGTTFYDNVTSLGLFLSALLVITQFDRLMTQGVGRAFVLALLCGLPAGLMMGLKLPCVIFCVGLCFSILITGRFWKRQFLVSFAFGIGVIVGVAITLGYWAWFLENQFGNPLFPYFNDIFKSPLAPLASARDLQFVPFGFWARLLFPYHFALIPYMVGEIPWRDWRIPLFYTALPLSLILRLVMGRRPNPSMTSEPARNYLLGVGAIAYLAWLFMFGIYRYAIPLEMLAPLLLVLSISLIPVQLKLRSALICVALLVTMTSIVPGTWGRRAEWSERYIEATVPSIDAKDLMILMGGINPYAHLLSEFPPEISFLRIDSNFARPGDGKGINQIIAHRIRSHHGPFMLLIPQFDLDVGKKDLLSYNLRLEDPLQPCQTVVDRLYQDMALSLCKVVRTNPT